MLLSLSLPLSVLTRGHLLPSLLALPSSFLLGPPPPTEQYGLEEQLTRPLSLSLPLSLSRLSLLRPESGGGQAGEAGGGRGRAGDLAADQERKYGVLSQFGWELCEVGSRTMVRPRRQLPISAS